VSVIVGVDEGRAALDRGESVVVVDGAEALAALLAERRAGGPGRLAVLVGDPADEAVLAAARAMAEELFHQPS
jgi:hypothetical protein